MTKEQWTIMMRAATNIEEAARKFLKSPPTRQTIIHEAEKIKYELSQITHFQDKE